MKIERALVELERNLKYLNSTPMGRRTFLQVAPLLLAACATPDHKHREGDNSGQETDITVQDERKMTKEYLPQMSKDYPMVKNQKAQNYLQNLGRNIVAANNLEGHPYNYNFRLVESKTVNAFALPAGEVFVTAPLIKLADSEAELAGVIGHEVGHIKARHTAERMDRAKKSQTKNILYSVGGAILGGIVGHEVGKRVCKKDDRQCLENAAKYGAYAGGAGTLLIQKYQFMANSQEDEHEADRIGFKTSYQAGYHKDHIGRFYSKLLVMEQKHKGQTNPLMARLADVMSTHPPSKERVAQMNDLSRQAPVKKGSIISTQEFSAIKRMV